MGHLAHCLAAHGLQPDAGWLDHLPGWTDVDALPVMIVLRDFARWLAVKVGAEAKVKAEPSLVWEFIASRLQAQNLTFVVNPLTETLEAGQAFLIFDGLDEIVGRGIPAWCAMRWRPSPTGTPAADAWSPVVPFPTGPPTGSLPAIPPLSWRRSTRTRSIALWLPGTLSWPSRVSCRLTMCPG